MPVERVQQEALAIQCWGPEKVRLIKEHVAQGCSDSELAYFLEVAQAVGLNPLKKEVYAIKRWDARLKKEKLTIQTGIDGFRKIAHRTGVCLGISAPDFRKEGKGKELVAAVVVKKLVAGHVCEFPAEARWSEYAQKTKNGAYTHMWSSKPYLMLGKCAEALALRKAFADELSGVYTSDEMGTAAPAPEPTKPSNGEVHNYAPPRIPAEPVAPPSEPEPEPAPTPEPPQAEENPF